MKILIVSATWVEIKPLLAFLNETALDNTGTMTCQFGSHQITICVTGVGMVSTAFNLGKLLSNQQFDIAVNLGIAGSFGKFKIGDTVHITSDIISELGAEHGDRFLQFDKLQMDEATMNNSLWKVKNEKVLINDIIHNLPSAIGISVNTIHGRKSSIENTIQQFQPDVESMEGAAFLLACRHYNLPSAQIRTISNLVEERNTANWEIDFAIQNLNKKAIQLISHLNGK